MPYILPALRELNSSTAKLSKTIENITNKNPEVISRDVQKNSNLPTKS